MDDRLSLLVGGRRFYGWTEVSVSRDLDTVSAGFEIGLTDRWEGRPERWEIEPGDACEVFIGADRVITGFIDQADHKIEAGAREIRIAGRDKTSDLIDCSAMNTPGSWKGRSLEQIAAELAQPFGVSVKAVASTGAPFDKFALQQGETVAEALGRLTSQRGVLAVTNEDGELEFRRPGTTAGGYTLELGVNLVSAGFKNDGKDRYSDYLFKAHPEEGAEGAGGRAPTASAKDPGVRRHRPLMIVNDDIEGGRGPSLEERAKWEATVRAAKAQSATAAVRGWRSADGGLYRIDRRVPVRARAIGLDQELLVAGVLFTLDGQGQRTEFTLARPEAYSLLAIPESEGKGTALKPLASPKPTGKP